MRLSPPTDVGLVRRALRRVVVTVLEHTHAHAGRALYWPDLLTSRFAAASRP